MPGTNNSQVSLYNFIDVVLGCLLFSGNEAAQWSAMLLGQLLLLWCSLRQQCHHQPLPTTSYNDTYISLGCSDLEPETGHHSQPCGGPHVGRAEGC